MLWIVFLAVIVVVCFGYTGFQLAEGNKFDVSVAVISGSLMLVAAGLAAVEYGQGAPVEYHIDGTLVPGRIYEVSAEDAEDDHYALLKDVKTGKIRFYTTEGAHAAFPRIFIVGEDGKPIALPPAAQ